MQNARLDEAQAGIKKVLMNWWKLNQQCKNTRSNGDSVLRDTEGGLMSSAFCFDFFAES